MTIEAIVASPTAKASPATVPTIANGTSATTTPGGCRKTKSR